MFHRNVYWFSLYQTTLCLIRSSWVTNQLTRIVFCSLIFLFSSVLGTRIVDVCVFLCNCSEHSPLNRFKAHENGEKYLCRVRQGNVTVCQVS
jgi:hypothetical protein